MFKFFATVFILLTCQSGYLAQCATPTTVPYYENFQGIGTGTLIPPCWALSSTTTCKSATNTPNKFLGFYCNPPGSGYFFSRSVLLQAGIVYSASISYQFPYVQNSGNWTDLSIMLGTSQSSAGLSSIASLQPPPFTYFSQFGNTFTVTVSGIYYIAVRATSISNLGSANIWWDDLAITQPCMPLCNAPDLQLSANPVTVCEGDSVNLSVSGADKFTWNSGAMSNTLTYFPQASGYCFVAGTNTLANCSASDSIYITVKPSPAVGILAPVQVGDTIPVICEGASVPLLATGASSYTWNTGQLSPNILAMPALTSIYSVTGSLQGCSRTSTIMITVNPKPVINILCTPLSACVGESITLTASGAISYLWAYIQGAAVNGSQLTFVASPGTATFNVIGSDVNNCNTQASFSFIAAVCTNLEKNKSALSEDLFNPNPGNGIFMLNNRGMIVRSVMVRDLSGKLIMSDATCGEKTVIDLSAFNSGLYIATVTFDGSVRSIKLIKN